MHYNKDDQDFAIELAMRAAVAIDNARLYREAQEAIEKKDQALALLHAVLQQMPAGVVIAEAPSGKVLLRNQFAMDFWCGKSPVSEHLDMSGGYFTALHPDGSIFKDEDWPLSRALRTGASRVGEEFEVVKLNGEHCFLRTNSAPIRDREGKIIAAAVAFEDVTNRLLADRALRESEGKFRSLAEVAPCSIFIHDGHRLLYVNRATCEITGFSRQELLSKTIWELLHPESYITRSRTHTSP